MKFTIKDIKEKAEKGDKISFKAEVKSVYDGVEAKTKFSNYRQNIMVKDETDEIKVIYSYKEKGEEYPKTIIGKQVEIKDGKVSEYNGVKNIFGRLTFAEGEAPKQSIATKNQPITTGILEAISPQRDMRDISLQRAMEFWTARIGDKMEEQKIIATAEIFYNYLTRSPAKVSGQSKAKFTEERKELTGARTKGQVIKVDNIPLINEVMALKEEHNLNADQFESYCNGKDIKTMTTEELIELKKVLSEFTTNIPF